MSHVTRHTSWPNDYRGSGPDEFHQILRIPVRQPEAAVRFGAPHQFRDGCAVNAVARQVQADPRDPHGIIGPGLQNKFTPDGLRLRRFGKHFWIECVIRIGRDGCTSIRFR